MDKNSILKPLGLSIVLIGAAALLLLGNACTKTMEAPYNSDLFTTKLRKLQAQFQIPGLAAAIEKDGKIIYQEELGFADLEQQIKIDSSTLFPIASITKVFSGVLVMKLVEQGKLSLDDPIVQYLPDSEIPDSILVKHVLSHTSQGKLGEQFYYSSRFGLLTPVLEQASGQDFYQLMETEIFEPLGMHNSLLLTDSVQITQQKLNIAKPYRLAEGIEEGLDERIEEGRIEFGYSASAGIVSNLRDMLIFNRALDSDLLLSTASKALMFSPNAKAPSFAETAMSTSSPQKLPYGYGIFSQDFEGLQLVWAYGQYDCYSSLLLKVPEKNISLILLANNNLMSDPARLIYGNVARSLFALEFLKSYVLALSEPPESGPVVFSEEEIILRRNLNRQEWLAEALADSFFARFDDTRIKRSTQALEKTFKEFPDYLDYADLSLLHNLSFLKDVAFHKDLGPFNTFDVQLEAIGKKLLEEDPNNPYAHYYMGSFYDREGDLQNAKKHYEQIVNAVNFSKNWYTVEAENWLKGQ